MFASKITVPGNRTSFGSTTTRRKLCLPDSSYVRMSGRLRNHAEGKLRPLDQSYLVYSPSFGKQSGKCNTETHTKEPVVQHTSSIRKLPGVWWTFRSRCDHRGRDQEDTNANKNQKLRLGRPDNVTPSVVPSPACEDQRRQHNGTSDRSQYDKLRDATDIMVCSQVMKRKWWIGRQVRVIEGHACMSMPSRTLAASSLVVFGSNCERCRNHPIIVHFCCQQV